MDPKKNLYASPIHDGRAARTIINNANKAIKELRAAHGDAAKDDDQVKKHLANEFRLGLEEVYTSLRNFHPEPPIDTQTQERIEKTLREVKKALLECPIFRDESGEVPDNTQRTASEPILAAAGESRPPTERSRF